MTLLARGQITLSVIEDGKDYNEYSGNWYIGSRGQGFDFEFPPAPINIDTTELKIYQNDLESQIRIKINDVVVVNAINGSDATTQWKSFVIDQSLISSTSVNTIRIEHNGSSIDDWGTIYRVLIQHTKSGADGEDGVSVLSITEQYYLSTSKTTTTGGSWLDHTPTWSKGKYLWVRSKVTYTSNKVGENPTYTAPYCDSSWEAIEDIQVGGANQMVVCQFNHANKYLVSQGTEVSAGGYGYTDYIAIPYGAKSIVASGASNYGGSPATCYYDANKNFLIGVSHNVYSSTSEPKVYHETIPNVEGVAYLRFSLYSKYIDYTMLEFGNKPSAWRESQADLDARIDAAKDTNLRESIFTRSNTTTVPITPTAVGGIWKDEFYEIPPMEGARYTWISERKKSNGIWESFSKPSIFATWSKDGDKGADGRSVVDTDVEYVQSTSSTTAPTSGWQTTSPTWINGRYVWQRVKTTFSTGEPHYSTPINITGQAGATGGIGASGVSILNISEQFYLSTSKTTLSGGSWVSTHPVWSVGKYVWIRSQITYSSNKIGENPTYTEPYCDSSWEAIEGVQVGGVNYANDTSGDWSNPYSVSSTVNYCVPLGRIMLGSFKVGDWIAYRVVVRLSNIVNITGSNTSLIVQGAGDVTGWSSGAFPSHKVYSSTNEMEIILSEKIITESHLQNNYFSTNLRVDNVLSGTIEVKEFMVENGNTHSSWRPSEVDVQNAIAKALQVGESAQNSVEKLDDKLTQAKTDIEIALSDGLQDSDKLVFTETKKSIATAQKELVIGYNGVSTNVYLEDSIKSELVSSYNNLAIKYVDVISQLTSIIASNPLSQSLINSYNTIQYPAYDTALDLYSTNLSNANKAIQKRLNSLSAGYVDDIIIGGVNLVDYTRSTPPSDFWKTAGWSSIKPIYEENEDALVLSASNGWQTSVVDISHIEPPFTISFRYKPKTSNLVGRSFYMGLFAKATYTPEVYKLVTISDEEWVSVSITYTEAQPYFGFNIRGVDSQGELYEFYIRNLMVEYGNKRSSYQESPNDVKRHISQAQAVADAITAKAESEGWATKLTHIDSSGIFTGQLSANTITSIRVNASQITAGTIDTARLNTDALKSTLITASNINALTLDVVRGKIGGWSIESGVMKSSNISLDSKNRRVVVYGASSSPTSGHRTQLYYNSDSDFGFYATNISGAAVAQFGSTNRVAGWNITSSYIYKNSVYLGSDGSIYNGTKWKLANDGSGLLANSNIKWDASGNVTFGSAVSLLWSAPIGEIREDIESNVAPKITELTSTGIYTGTLTATQVNAVAISASSITTGTLSADRIASGSISATKLDATSIKSSIINTDYINGLSCTFTKGTIGGWSISGGNMTCGQIALNSSAKRIAVYGSTSSSTSGHRVQFYYSSDSNFGFYATDSSGNCITQLGSSNHIAGWKITTSSIAKNSVSLGADGTISNGSKWRLANDGSGSLANSSIVWDVNGNITFSSAISLLWSAPISALSDSIDSDVMPKLTKIDSTGVYTGTLTANQVNALAISASSITTGTLSADRIAAGSITASKLNAASIQADIINASYINGLTCSFTKGTIGGWSISSGIISCSQIAINATSKRIAVYSSTSSSTSGHRVQLYYGSDTSFGFYATNSSGACIAQLGSTNQISGWQITSSYIYKNSVYLGSDGSIYNSSNKWKLANDGSGRVANGNISWDASGNVSFDTSVSLNWTTAINQGKLYVRGTGYNHNAYRMVILNGTTVVNNGSRGLSVTIINRSTLAYESTTNYDTYTSETYCNDMATKLDSIGADKIVVITSYDAIRINSTLSTALQRCGGSDFTTGADCVPYALIGIPTIGKNNGLEAVCSTSSTAPYAEISTQVENGIPQGVSTNGKLLTHITGTGVYTGSLSADQIVAGQIEATFIDTDGIKARILTADSINALTLTTSKGKIGGWNITSSYIYKNSVYFGSDGSIYNSSKWRLNNDGSGQLANGNITWNSAGGITAKNALFTNVRIEGSVRNPYVLNDPSIWIGGNAPDDQENFNNFDNIIAVRGSFGEDIPLPWTLENSGRRVTLINYKWNSTITSGTMDISAPSGKYFYEDGIAKTQLNMSREYVELMGYGDDTTFFGWIVVTKLNLMTSYRYGKPVRVLAQGRVTGTSSSASITYKTFDNTTMSVSRLGTGKYKITYSSTWGLSISNAVINLTGYGYSYGSSTAPIKGSVYGVYSTYMYVNTSDDNSNNDGSFFFQIINMNDWVY